MRQRHFQLLGRSLNLNALITQRQNTYFRQNIEYAISRFEASDLTAVVELENQLTNIQLAHRMMSKYLSLDSWDNISLLDSHFKLVFDRYYMLNEINESTSLISFIGRIVLHVIVELMYDFLPNYNYNAVTQRFVRAPFSFSTEPVPRDTMPKLSNPAFLYGNRALNSAYQNSVELYKFFFGIRRIAVIPVLRLSLIFHIYDFSL